MQMVSDKNIGAIVYKMPENKNYEKKESDYEGKLLDKLKDIEIQIKNEIVKMQILILKNYFGILEIYKNFEESDKNFEELYKNFEKLDENFKEIEKEYEKYILNGAYMVGKDEYYEKLDKLYENSMKNYSNSANLKKIIDLKYNEIMRKLNEKYRVNKYEKVNGRYKASFNEEDDEAIEEEYGLKRYAGEDFESLIGIYFRDIAMKDIYDKMYEVYQYIAFEEVPHLLDDVGTEIFFIESEIKKLPEGKNKEQIKIQKEKCTQLYNEMLKKQFNCKKNVCEVLEEYFNKDKKIDYIEHKMAIYRGLNLGW